MPYVTQHLLQASHHNMTVTAPFPAYTARSWSNFNSCFRKLSRNT